MTLEKRATGWLDPLHHARLREFLCHALARHRLVCAAHCLMPDHAHFLWLGLAASSDQRLAAALFREVWNGELRQGSRALQRQPHDHVLRERERERGAFGTVANYVCENPVRAGLVDAWRDYPYLGALVPGYPDLDPRDEDYWDRFWRIYKKLAEPGSGMHERCAPPGESLTASATAGATAEANGT
jgi:putative transposase